MADGESNGHVTQKGQTRDSNTLRAQYFENNGDAILSNNR